jgi:hypothetical protein
MHSVYYSSAVAAEAGSVRAWTEPEVAVINRYLSATAATPEFDNPDEIGGILKVTPTISLETKYILMLLNSKYIRNAGVNRYKWNYTVEKNNTFSRFSDLITMPVFEKREVETNTRIFNNQNICVGRVRVLPFSPSKDKSYGPETSLTEIIKTARNNGEKTLNIFFFISAKIVTPDGSCVWK